MPELDTALDQDHGTFFEHTFKKNFKGLVRYAFTVVKDEEVAEEIVQNMFVRLWEKKEQISISETVTGYLYRSVYNDSLNHIKHLKVRDSYRSFAMERVDYEPPVSQQIEAKELELRIGQALAKLPEKCRTIFQMSRFEELRYQEIADELDLPVKTIENQMGKALRLLRVSLADYLPSLLLVLLPLFS